MQIGKYRLEGGGCCPEQYDVFEGKKEVGYLRLRHGQFSADWTEDGRDTTVYEGYPSGDGGFDDDEREKYLTAAVQAIDAARCPNHTLQRTEAGHAVRDEAMRCHICGSDNCTQMHPERWGNNAKASVSISWDAAIGAIEDIAQSAKKGSFATYDVKLLRRVADEIESKI